MRRVSLVPPPNPRPYRWLYRQFMHALIVLPEGPDQRVLPARPNIILPASNVKIRNLIDRASTRSSSHSPDAFPKPGHQIRAKRERERGIKCTPHPPPDEGTRDKDRRTYDITAHSNRLDGWQKKDHGFGSRPVIIAHCSFAHLTGVVSSKQQPPPPCGRSARARIGPWEKVWSLDGDGS